MQRKIKVLIVDDSITFQEMMRRGLGSDPMIEVVDTATDPYEARDKILKYHPDVMTLDVNLPRMNGIEFLRKLMPQYPLPVVVVSVMSESVFDALDAGAVEFVNKPNGRSPEQVHRFISSELATKIKIASVAKVGHLKKTGMPAGGVHRSVKVDVRDRVIAIGASTGGTEAIFDVVKRFDVDIPGVVIVQHMPPKFTEMYAQRLNNQCKVVVKEAKNGDVVRQGQVLIAPGDRQMQLLRVNGVYQVKCGGTQKVSGHCPSVNVLFHSVADTAGRDAVGVILTGMGADGAEGLLAMRNAGAETIGQDENSCVVYGMPKVAMEIGAVKYQVPLENIAGKVYNILGNKHLN